MNGLGKKITPFSQAKSPRTEGLNVGGQFMITMCNTIITRVNELSEVCPTLWLVP